MQLMGYARTKLTAEELRTKLRPFLKGDPKEVDDFLAHCRCAAAGVEAASAHRAAHAHAAGWARTGGRAVRDGR